MLYILQFYSNMNQIYMDDIVTHVGVVLFKFYVTYNPFKLWCDWDVWGKVAQYYSPCFIVTAEALGTITFILFVRGRTDNTFLITLRLGVVT